MAEVEMDDQNRIKELQQQLEHAREHLRQEMEKLDQEMEKLEKQSQEIEDKYGIDYLHFIQGKPMQQQIKILRVVNQIFNVDGELLTTLTEEYIEKRDGTRVLLRIVG